MDLSGFMQKWRGKEVIAFSGQVKYRGVLSDILEGGFLVFDSVAIINPGGAETSEYAEYDVCVVNVAELSGLACEEQVGRGAESVEEY